MSPKTLAFITISMLGVSVTHMAFPSLWMATALWLGAAVMIVVWARMLRRRDIPIYGAVLVGIGALSNAVVMLVNGGTMPVIGMAADLNYGAWRSAESGDHLLFLSDRMALGGASPGDLLVAIGLLFSLSIVFFRGARSMSGRLRSTMA